MKLRRADAADAGKLALLGSATFLTAFASDHPGDALVAHCRDQHSEVRYAAWADDPAYALWIAETPLGAPVGYAMLSPPDLDIAVEPDAVELKRIYTLGAWQGRGLGHRLIETVIGEARSRQAPNLYLCVYETNEMAQRFYARHGFVRVGTQKFMVGDVAFTDWILRCEL